MSSGLEGQAGFQKEAGYTQASVFVPQQLTTVLPSRAGPYTVHTRLVHLGGNLCVFLGSDVLNRCGDRRLIVEV